MSILLTSLADLSDLATLDVDTIIDVRAPSEFAQDHVPNAINLPVLDDAERAQVGTIYKRESPFRARKIGAALVASNAARHLNGALAGHDGGWRPLIYCWRGGQRSHSFATILAQVGWRVAVLDGGYRSYRRLVGASLHDRPLGFRLVLLDGDTGTAKTEMLAALAGRGHQILDLEGLAAHRGSIFGALPGGQPSQKAFESGIAQALAGFDPDRPVIVEAESARIGQLGVPPSLWAAMQAAPRVAVSAPLTERSAHLLRAYADLVTDQGRLTTAIAGLRPFHPGDRIETWLDQARQRRFEDLARSLMRHHYDPRYARASARKGRGCVVSVAFDRLDPEGLADGLSALETALETAFATTPHSPGPATGAASGGPQQPPAHPDPTT